MANSHQNFEYSFYVCSLVLTALAQVAISHTLGRDTLKTISANETYQVGYRTRKFQQSYFYSAASGLGLIRLARQELKIYNAAVEASNKRQAFGGARFETMILNYLEDYEETSGILIKRTILNDNESKASKVAGDLIAAYRMVRRFRSYIQHGLCEVLAKVQDLSSRNPNNSETLKTLKPLSRDGPFKRDIHLTMFAIIFTQLQYEWTSHDVSMGTLKGMELGTTMHAVHCIELGVHAVASGIYSVGIDWLELAAIKIQNGDQSADLNLTLDLLQKAKAKHDKLWHPLTFWSLNATFFTKRLNETSRNDTREWQRSIAIDSSNKKQSELVEDRSWESCAGQLEQTEKTKYELFCWHETTIHLSWKLGPLRVELLAKFPYQVIQFHDVLGSGITNQIFGSCDILLETADLFVTQKHFDPKLRLCENCVGSYNELYSLTRRITGHLSAGSIQTSVSIYPPGGHTRLHIDNNGKDYTDRSMATMTYFLEGPEIGGEVVFSNARVAAKPLKGSAIFWYNLLQSSELDYSTTHASCSVVKGHKTIATHGISYRLEPHLTCDKNPDAKMKYFFNGKPNIKN